MKDRYDRFFWQARCEFNADCAKYGRLLAVKLLCDAYTSKYQEYMRNRDSVYSTNRFLSRFMYVHAMALLTLWRREHDKLTQLERIAA